MSTLSEHESRDLEKPADSEGRTAAEPSAEPANGDGGSYDFLFAPTEFRSVEAAAVRELPEDDAATAPVPSPRASESPPQPSESSAVPPEPVPPEPVPPEPVLPVVLATDDSADGRTVRRDRLPTAAVPPSTPMVPAVRCPAGHLNPPQTAACRICGVTVPAQAPTTAPRPALGVLRLPNNDTVVIDRGVLVGRRPRIEAWTGDGRPHLVQVNDPEGAVSRNHVRIDVDGWTVLVTDLNSTNGTTVAQGTTPAHPLVAGEATPLDSGAVVRLGDSVSLTYEVAAQSQSPLLSVAQPEARDEAESHPAKAGWLWRRRHRNR